MANFDTTPPAEVHEKEVPSERSRMSESLQHTYGFRRTLREASINARLLSSAINLQGNEVVWGFLYERFGTSILGRAHLRRAYHPSKSC